MLEHLSRAVAETFQQMFDVRRTHDIAPELWWCGRLGQPAVVNALQEGFGILGLLGQVLSELLKP